MQTLFLGVLNMSMTASFVIPAVLLTRFLLRRAPKKYSYLLWSVVLYRLICPASFLSAISIFGLRLFHMAAQRGGGAILSHIPSNVGQMQTPKVTVGFPVLNPVIGDSLPQAILHAGANSLQQWIALASVLWCVGIVILILHNLVACMRVRHRAATAVRLEGNVYESDSIRSPFISAVVQAEAVVCYSHANWRRSIEVGADYHAAFRVQLSSDEGEWRVRGITQSKAGA